MEKRYASFYVSNRFIKDHPDAVIKLMEGMIVLEATPSFTRDAIRYTTWHKWFPSIRPGYEAPVLEVEVRYLDREPIVAYFMKDYQTIIHSKGLV